MGKCLECLLSNRHTLLTLLGGSIGNFRRPDAANFVKSFVDTLSPADNFLIGVDACQNADKVSLAYNDPTGVTKRFTLNGLKHANKLLCSEVFKLEEWSAVGQYSHKGGCNQAFVFPKVDVDILGVHITKGEMIQIEESNKYSPTQKSELWRQAGTIEAACWMNSTGDYGEYPKPSLIILANVAGLHMLKAVGTMSASKPQDYAPHPVPSLEEWQALWKVWDIVTLQMIPNEELKAKPIKLRNACIFYLGHIPTFLDMKLSQGLDAPPTEPKYYHSIFERGIDPDVDNPEHCHAHSDIPDEWPPLEDILQYQERVRARVTSMYTSGLAYETFWAGRVLWLGLEHEAMHLETLLYMLLQSDKTLPPAGVDRPDFEQLAKKAAAMATNVKWIDVPAQTVHLGLNDPDTRDGPLRHFGWDVEKPQRQVEVKAFKAASRPITIGEYAEYLIATAKTTMPASWTSYEDTTANGVNQTTTFMHDKAVRTMFGPVPLRSALHWPVSASYDELSACAAYMGGRIPTLEEAHSMYGYAACRKKEQALQALQGMVPAVNG